MDPDSKESQHVLPTEELLIVELDPDNRGRFTRIGSQLEAAQAQQMVEFLRANTDFFAWEPADLTGIDPTIVRHCLNTIE